MLLVRASRGKYTRAEPVAALYEQNLVHHVGMFSELEDQLVTFVPSDAAPDRLLRDAADALVWAITARVEGTGSRCRMLDPSDLARPNAWAIGNGGLGDVRTPHLYTDY